MPEMPDDHMGKFKWYVTKQPSSHLPKPPRPPFCEAGPVAPICWSGSSRTAWTSRLCHVSQMFQGQVTRHVLRHVVNIPPITRIQKSWVLRSYENENALVPDSQYGHTWPWHISLGIQHRIFRSFISKMGKDFNWHEPWIYHDLPSKHGLLKVF